MGTLQKNTLRPPLRGVCIGAGYFSHYHYDAWNRIPEVEIVAISDLQKSKAENIIQQYAIPRYYEDYQKMIDQEAPDFVDIITGPAFHSEICQYVAKQGIDMICQKPLAPTYEESEAIVQLIKKFRIRLMVHENFRWQPWYQEVKKLFENQTLGKLHSMYMRVRPGDGWGDNAYLGRQPYFRDYPRFLLYETGVHFIDTFRFLGGEIKNVYAHLKRLNPVIQGEDSGVLLLVFESGATAILDANRYNEIECEDPRYTFGEFRIDTNRGHLEMDSSGNMTLKMLNQPTQPHPYFHQKKGFGGDCCYALQKHFVECLLADKPFDNPAEDYLKTLQVVEACYQSATTGQAIILE